MPLPIAHSTIGFASYFATKGKNLEGPPRQEIFLLGLCIFLSILPDMDFVSGIFFGEPGKFHHGISHSIAFCLIIALISYSLVNSRLKGISRKRILACSLLSTLSHPILDYFSLDTSKPFGLPLFWPFDTQYYMSYLSIFRDARRIEDTVGTFFTSLISIHNGWELVLETLFAGIILCALFGFKTRTKPIRSLSCFLTSTLCGILYYLIQTSPIIFK